MRSLPVFALALFSICLSVAAQFLLKAGMSEAGTGSTWTRLLQPYILGGFALYGLGAIVWLGVLERWEVSRAYPLVGLGFAFAALIGWWLGDQMTWTRVAGVCLICAGVALVGNG